MTTVYSFVEGSSPLIVSIPHDGRELAPGMAERMTEAGLELPDTDWHVRRLYEFSAGMGASVLAANFSRYVVDLNRPANDEALYAGQVSTGLCPETTFAGDAISREDAAVSAEERADRTRRYWQPYHDRLQDCIQKAFQRYGFALLWDAHSIAGEVPRLFEGTLPDLNIGTNGERSCATGIADAVSEVASTSDYSAVLNGRFKGGYITRQYGNPGENVHAIQLELAQRNYMDEKTRDFDPAAAGKLAATIRNMLTAFTESAKQHARNR